MSIGVSPMRHNPAARLPAADFTGKGSPLVSSNASSRTRTPTFAAVSPNLVEKLKSKSKVRDRKRKGEDWQASVEKL